MMTALILWLASAPVLPDLAMEREARDLTKLAEKALRDGNKDAALDHYRAAYAAFPDPNVLCHIGATLERMRRLVEAAQQYEECIEDAAVDGEIRRRSRRHLLRLRTRLARVIVEVTPAGARISLDGRASGSAEGPLSIWVDPGAHTVAAEMDGFQRVAEALDLRAGDKRQLRLRLAMNDPDGLAPAPGWACEDIHPAEAKPYVADALVSPPAWAATTPMAVQPKHHLTDQLAPPPPWVTR